MRFLFGLMITSLLATVAVAEEDDGWFSIGSDIFRAGQSVSVDAAGLSDLFLAGETVVSTADIVGTAHVAGRFLTLSGRIGGNAYAMGQKVALTGPVAGNVTLLGQEVTVEAPVMGNLRATASELAVTGDIGGYALLVGEKVALDGPVDGDVTLTAREVDFGTKARIGGKLILYESSPGSVTVPAAVVPAERVERHLSDGWDQDRGYGMRIFSWRAALGGFVAGVLVIAGIAALIALLAPEMLAAMRRRILDRPGRTLGLGFVSLSAICGAGLVVALTGIGILLTPAFLVLALLAGFFGYVIGAYALGVAVLRAAGRHLPEAIGDRALAAGVGATLAGVIAMVPLLGWLFVLALVLTGLGALAARLLPDHLSGTPRY